MNYAAVRAAAALTLAALAVTACSTSTSGPQAATVVAVNAGETTCEVGTTTLPAGRHTFEITNSGGQVTEVYVYGTADRIMGEQENIGPSTKRTMIVDLPAGAYQVACKPGMVGNGNRTALTITGTAASAAALDANLASAVASYRAYVETETQALVDATATFRTCPTTP